MIETQKLTLKCEIMQCPGLIASNMDGEKVMLSISNGKYYNLGELGGVIWDFIEKPKTIKEIVDSLMAEYDVSQEICEEEVLSFLNSLLNENIISVEGR